VVSGAAGVVVGAGATRDKEKERKIEVNHWQLMNIL
jgi:hypothetical protein